MSIFQIDPDTDEIRGFSFSGHERNRLFLRRGKNFEDFSLRSGADFTEDGRGFVVFDFDNDGAVDLGVVSNQNPRFRLLQNKLAADSAGFVKLRLVGGNKTATPSVDFSPRDPIGATVSVTTSQHNRLFRLSVGEGFSVQNSRTIHIGMGAESQIDQLKIRWPSGKITVETEIEVGSTVEISENRN